MMARKRKKRQLEFSHVSISFLLFLVLFGFYLYEYYKPDISTNIGTPVLNYASTKELPSYQGDPYVILNNNEPEFASKDFSTTVFESYSELDHLGRAGVAYANIGLELMPTEERGSIGSVKPSGWHTIKYDFVDGKYLYNRCHLIGYQLTGENANEKNLITCTRSMNAKTMLYFENQVADYIKRTHHHVLYRVTPIYQENNLLAMGVEMEAMSVEDKGKELKFHVFVYNVEEGVEIDYATGDSKVRK